MRKNKTFLDGKLTEEEFSKKYWQNGALPYQYHTGEITDGRDEREQFLFNNIRALREMIDFYQKYNRDARVETRRILKKQKKQIKLITALAATSTVIAVITFIILNINYLK